MLTGIYFEHDADGFSLFTMNAGKWSDFDPILFELKVG